TRFMNYSLSLWEFSNFVFTGVRHQSMHGIKVYNDAELLQQIRAGDKVAFRNVYERYWERLYRVARSKVGQVETAEEMIQDIFADVWERRESLSVINLERYLFRAVKYKALDYIRAQIVKRYNEDEILNASSEYTDAEAEEELAYQELKRAFDSGLNSLPEKTRGIFCLNKLEQLSVREISAELGIPQRTVSYHIAQALSVMRVHLKDFILCCVGGLLI